MTFETFKEALKAELEKEFPGQTELTDVKLVRGSYTGLTIKQPGRITSPVFNLEAAYNDFAVSANGYDAVKAVADMIRRFNESSRTEGDELIGQFSEILDDYELAKKHLVIRMLLRENVPEDVISDDVFNDMAMTYAVAPDESNEYMASVTKDMLEAFGVSEETLRQDAIANSMSRWPAQTEDLGEIVGAESNGMRVLSNRDKLYGAGALFYPGTARQMWKEIGEYYVLPSSVHEVILVPKDYGKDTSALKEMVRVANIRLPLFGGMPENDVLSNDVYSYNPVTGMLEVA